MAVVGRLILVMVPVVPVQLKGRNVGSSCKGAEEGFTNPRLRLLAAYGSS